MTVVVYIERLNSLLNAGYQVHRASVIVPGAGDLAEPLKTVGAFPVLP